MQTVQSLLNGTPNKTLLAIFPHPDDETVPVGGLLLEAKRMGWRTVAICLTRGELGKVSFKTSESTRDIRTKEYINAVTELNVDKYYLLDFKDSKLKDSKEEIQEKVLDLIKEINPGAIVTYDPSGITGHPDHIALSIFILELFKKNKFDSKLIWPSLSGLPKLFNKNSLTYKYFSIPNLRLHSTLQTRIRKAKAFLQHKSQIDSFHNKILFILYSFLISENYFLVNLEKDYPYEYVDFEI